jgi:hypothetical protein
MRAGQGSAEDADGPDAWLWPALLGASAAGAALVSLADVQAPIRTVLTLWFLMVCPGMACVRLLRLRRPLYEWSLAIALSLALDMLVAEAPLYLGWWSPRAGLLVLLWLTVGAGFVQWEIARAKFS